MGQRGFSVDNREIEREDATVTYRPARCISAERLIRLRYVGLLRRHKLCRLRIVSNLVQASRYGRLHPSDDFAFWYDPQGKKHATLLLDLSKRTKTRV